MGHAVRVAAVAAVLAIASGCSERAPRSPTATVQAFLEAMDRAASDHEELARAFDLLTSAAQKGLAARAAKAHMLGGSKLEPWQMLVQGRFRLRFQPTSMTERVEGETAVVTVAGDGPGERADVPLIREGGRWKLALKLPAVHGGDTGDGGSPEAD